jgi:hypothetical protein
LVVHLRFRAGLSIGQSRSALGAALTRVFVPWVELYLAALFIRGANVPGLAAKNLALILFNWFGTLQRCAPVCEQKLVRVRLRLE